VAEEKYRPYFTASELIYIIESVKMRTPINQSLVRYLDGFALKIKSGVLLSSYTPNPALSISEKLGFSVSSSPFNQAGPSIQKLVNIWTHSPETRAQMSAAQLIEIADYRYTNDLMSEEESNEYESNLINRR